MAQGDEIDLALFESGRTLMLAEAELILVPNVCSLEQNRISQFKAQAFENMLGLAMAVNRIGFDEQEHSRDVTLVEADRREGIWLASLGIDTIREYRSREAWGDAYRKPRAHRGIDARCARGDARRFFPPTSAADRSPGILPSARFLHPCTDSQTQPRICAYWHI